MKEGTKPTESPEDLLAALSVPSALGVKPTLERMRRLVAALGEPQERLRVLHVGGTSGKGSTATIAAAILQAAGLHVGLHAKPHLHSVTERFVVDGQPIAAADLKALLREAESAARAVRPSWFELAAALAFLYFARAEVDAAVVEVGLGGTFDATNVVQPTVAVLTNVGLDHTEILGDTVEQIAADKVGIVKPGTVVVSGVRQPSVRGIVEERCRETAVPLWLLGREVTLRIRELSEDGTALDLSGPGFVHEGLRLALLGSHQAENAALAVAAAHAFVRQTGLLRGELSDAVVREVLARVRVPGRLEEFRVPVHKVPTEPRVASRTVTTRNPICVVLDGAHNPDKMAALAGALRSLFRWRRLVGVVAFKRGHDHHASLASLAPLLDHVVCTRFSAETDYGRDVSQPPEDLREAVLELNERTRVELQDDPVAAVREAIAQATEDDLVVVTGSLYLVGAVRQWLREVALPEGE